MRKIIFLMVALVVMAVSASAQNDDTRLTMSFNNEPLPSVFLRLEKSSAYKFLFTYDDVQNYTVNGTVKNAKFMDIVNYVLKDKPLSYKVDGKFINVTLNNAKKPSSKDFYTVGGYVFDKQGNPVIGAQVKVLGTNIIAVTDINGAFNLEYMMGGKGEVQFSYVGMKTKVVPMQREMRVVLEEDAQSLDDVVVTGIFKKAKESYTGSVSQISSEQLEVYKGQNLLQTLKNIDASLNFQVNNLAGSNPNNLPNLSIRGNSSVPTDLKEFNEGTKNSGNTPLIILDGFEISLERLMDYNDEEIENINILKDAAATAIYGSRGANGVIVVSTKQPKAGQLRVNFEAGIVLEVPDLTSYDLLNASEKLALEKAAGVYTDSDPIYQTKLDTRYNNKLRNVVSGIDTDWLSKPLRTGVGQEYKVRLEGGSDEFRWGASASYNETAGAMKDSNRRNFNGAITLLYKVKQFTFRNYTSVAINNSRESKYGSFSDYVKMQPYYSPYDDNGNLVKSFTLDSTSGVIANPLYDASLNSFDKSHYQEIANNFSVEWQPLEEFILRGQFSITNNLSGNDKFVSPYAAKFTASEYTTEEGMLRKGTYNYGNGEEVDVDANITASYAKTFADVHQVYVGLDWSISQRKSDYYYFDLEGFSTDAISNLATANQYSSTSTPTGTNNFYRRFGLTANVNYTYDNRYYADLSYRIDGNSNFGSNKKYAPFWSAGIGWSLHNEKFIKEHTSDINLLRLKASYGQTGTQLSSSTGAVSSYQYITDTHYLNWAGAQLQGWGNTNLTWQKTDEFNFGIEWGFWNNRWKGTFDVYTKKTSNLLSYMDLPLSTGFSNYLANVGETKNRGWEFTTSVYAIRDRKHDFSWMLTGQLVYNDNEITKLSDDIKAQNEAYLAEGVEVASLLEEGRPVNAIYGVRSLGIDPSTGEEIYLDKNGNITNTWSAKDIVYLGNADPKYRGIFSTMLNYKGWTLNLSFSTYWGGQVYNSTLRDRVEVTTSTIASSNVDRRVLEQRWMNPGDVVSFKKLSDITSKATSRYVQNDNVLELQSVSLQYKWTAAYLKKYCNLQSVIFGINASDLFHWGSVKMERGTSYPYARNIQGSIKLLF